MCVLHILRMCVYMCDVGSAKRVCRLFKEWLGRRQEVVGFCVNGCRVWYVRVLWCVMLEVQKDNGVSVL